MSRPRIFALLGAPVSAALVLGCALTSKSEAMAPRYFTLEQASSPPSGHIQASAPRAGPAVELRLGRVTGPAHLGERLAFRDAERELGYYEERRWTEAPEQYLRRRLSRVLFEHRGVRRALGGAAPTLDVEIVALEEVRGRSRSARVEVVARLQEPPAVRWEQTITADRPIAVSAGADAARAAVDALDSALAIVVDRIADRVVADLAARAFTAPERAPDPQFPAPRAQGAAAGWLMVGSWSFLGGPSRDAAAWRRWPSVSGADRFATL